MLFDTNADGTRVTTALQPLGLKRCKYFPIQYFQIYERALRFEGFQASPVGPYGKTSE
jgi:hypothetical protein